jgi:FMN phosphatase YigB (HAD superfamily)
MKKSIVFFDADGTIWYPRKTKREEHPVWLYRDSRYKNHEKHLVMAPTALDTIQELKKMSVITIILSTHPHLPKEADSLIQNKVRHFALADLFDEVHATREFAGSKGEFIERILAERKISKSKALMVGDSFKWDYNSAAEVGVDALLIETEYELEEVPVKNRIKKLSEILTRVI